MTPDNEVRMMVTEEKGQVHILMSNGRDEIDNHLWKLSPEMARQLGEKLFQAGCNAESNKG